MTYRRRSLDKYLETTSRLDRTAFIYYERQLIHSRTQLKDYHHRISIRINTIIATV